MAIQTINLGTAPTGIGGDDIRQGFTKVNANFAELSSLINGLSGGGGGGGGTFDPHNPGPIGDESQDAGYFTTLAAGDMDWDPIFGQVFDASINIAKTLNSNNVRQKGINSRMLVDLANDNGGSIYAGDFRAYVQNGNATPLNGYVGGLYVHTGTEGEASINNLTGVDIAMHAYGNTTASTIREMIGLNVFFEQWGTNNVDEMFGIKISSVRSTEGATGGNCVTAAGIWIDALDNFEASVGSLYENAGIIIQDQSQVVTDTISYNIWSRSTGYKAVNCFEGITALEKVFITGTQQRIYFADDILIESEAITDTNSAVAGIRYNNTTKRVELKDRSDNQWRGAATTCKRVINQTGTTHTPTSLTDDNLYNHGNAAPITVTLRNDAPLGAVMTYYQGGTGQITFVAGSGATLVNRQAHTKTAGQHAVVRLYVVSNLSGTSAVWVLSGDTAA